MDIKEIVKLQLVGSLVNPSYSSASHGATNSATKLVYQMIFMTFMSLMDDIVKFLPRVAEQIKAICVLYSSKYIRRKVEQSQIAGVIPRLADDAIALSDRHHLNTLEMRRIFEAPASSSGQTNKNHSDESNNESSGIVDAILAHIGKLENVPTFTLIKNGQILANYKERSIQIARDVFAQLKSIQFSPVGNVESIRLILMSNTLSASGLATYAKNLYQVHLQEIANALGNNIYFFDQKMREGNSLPPPPPPSGGANHKDMLQNHKRMLISTAPKQLSFTMTPFYSNKQFSNIYGDEIRLIEKRVRFFNDNRDWYDAKGIPYQLGILMSGVPGAGKTSAIRAIANMTKRHIINVNFANITTATQLKNLFYSDKIQVYTDASLSTAQSLYIPIEKRLYVLEEIDTVGDIVRQRDPNAPSAHVENDELTLMEILTVLDGTMEIPGRMVVMTTNHPEMLDAALVRPGRIDVQVNFQHSTRKQIAEMFTAYLDQPFPQERFDDLPDRTLTPAEVGQILFKYCNQDTLDMDGLMEEFKSTKKKIVHAPIVVTNVCASAHPSARMSVTSSSSIAATEDVPSSETAALSAVSSETSTPNASMSNITSSYDNAHYSSQPPVAGSKDFKVNESPMFRDYNDFVSPNGPLTSTPWSQF